MSFLNWLKGLFGRRGPEPKLLTGEPGKPPESETGIASDDPRLAKTKEELCLELDKAQKTIADLKRALADELNGKESFQKRLRMEQARVIDKGRAKVLLELLDVSDELDRALAALGEDDGPLAQGVRMVHDSMKMRLDKQGVKRMNLIGTQFDPNTAEATDIAPVQSQDQDGIVLQVQRPGFSLNGIVVRAARVCVGKWVAPPEPPKPETEGTEKEAAPTEAEAQAETASEPQDAAAPSGEQQAEAAQKPETPPKAEAEAVPQPEEPKTEAEKAEPPENAETSEKSEAPEPPKADEADGKADDQADAPKADA